MIYYETHSGVPSQREPEKVVERPTKWFRYIAIKPHLIEMTKIQPGDVIGIGTVVADIWPTICQFEQDPGIKGPIIGTGHIASGLTNDRLKAEPIDTPKNAESIGTDGHAKA